MNQDDTTQTMFDQPLAGESTFGRVIGRMGKKRMAVVAVLGIVAIGASRLPTHKTVAVEPEMNVKAVATSTTASVLGSNNLLGSASSNDLDSLVHATSVSDEHLVSGMNLGQGDANRMFDKLHSLIGVPAPKSDENTNAASANPVPEPASLALLAGAIAPTLIRRRRIGATA